MMEKVKDVINWIGDDKAIVQLLEPLFLYGIGMGLLFFGLCFFFRQEVGRKIGLAVIVLCCALFYPYLKFSEKVVDDVDKNLVFKSNSSLSAAVEAMKKQNDLRHHSQYYYYALGTLAAVALLLGSGKVGAFSSWATILASLGMVCFGLYLDMRDKRTHYIHMFAPTYVTDLEQWREQQAEAEKEAEEKSK